MSDFIDIDQAKLFQTIALAVEDATKEVLQSDQAKRIADLEAENDKLKRERQHLRNVIHLSAEQIEELEVRINAAKGFTRTVLEVSDRRLAELKILKDRVERAEAALYENAHLKHRSSHGAETSPAAGLYNRLKARGAEISEHGGVRVSTEKALEAIRRAKHRRDKDDE